VSLREREGLIARIRQIRRVAAPAEKPTTTSAADPSAVAVNALQERLAHLEHLVEGLQDSVHRESERHDKLIAELQAQVQPEAMGAALSRNARDRGL
jgi:hypothetical protein